MVDLPPSGQYTAYVRESCRVCTEDALLRSDASSIAALLASPYLKSSYADLSVSHGVGLPLVFPNALAELNLIALLSLLNFGAAYRVPLHRATGRGVYDNVRALIFALYLEESSGPSLMSAAGMQTITKEKVAELLQVSIHEETVHATIPGVTVGELKGPIFEFVSKITRVLNETGSILVQQHYTDLGAFVAEALNEAGRAGRLDGKGPSSDVVLERLVRPIPAFQDMHTVNGKPVYIFKKALFLIHAISLRFSNPANGNPPFAVPDSSDLPVFSDNVLPSMLVHLGAINVATATDPTLRNAFGTIDPSILLQDPGIEAKGEARAVPEAGPTLTPAQVAILRAAAITACDDIVHAAREMGMEMTTVGLDGWLWAGAKKRSDWRRLGRFVEEVPDVFF